MTTLVRGERPEGHDLEQLRARAAERGTLLEQRSAELARVTADLEAFRIAYRQKVGTLHEQLDALELAIAEAELGEISKRLEDAGQPDGTAAGTARPLAPRLTSDAVRRLFRDVAKTIHPDLAKDEDARSRRHALMIEANKAYALGDEQQLRWILDAWERSAGEMPGGDPEATRLRLVRRIEVTEEQLARLESDLAALKDSPLWKLKVMVEEAAAKRKDLIREMVGRLKRDILVATNRLDAMRPPG